MAYHDPYSNNQYSQQYQDAPFNPYEVQQQQASRGYQQGGHSRGFGQGTYGGYDAGYGYAEQDASGRTKETSTFEDDAVSRPNIRTPGNIRRWRKEHQEDLWTKGSRAGCFGRFFCCTLMIFLFFVVSIVLSLALDRRLTQAALRLQWLRPPNIIIGNPTPDLSTFAVNGTSISVALPVSISVNNPNYFTVELSSLDASVIYPINNTEIGSGHMTDIKFQDHTQTNFTFPVTISYDAKSDTSGAVIADLAKKCGVDPSIAATQVSVTVNIKVGLKIMLIPISTTVTQPVSFACNLGGALTKFEDLLNGLGINIGDLAGLL
ncbi:hypothetical protein C8Q80DRAFT_1120655 [Daedaleopsis nitida]|nr:hypothetical protein C8Q80DRAFT_1120655 [Daedaleopsis nitida]